MAQPSGSGMNSRSSPGTMPKRPSFQSDLARSIRAGELATKFHQMCRSPSTGAPPMSDEAAGAERVHLGGASVKHGHGAGCEPLRAHADLPLDDVDGAFGVLVRKRQRRPCLQRRRHVERRRADADRRARAVGGASHDLQRRARSRDVRNRRRGMVIEAGRVLFVGRRQRHPRLNPVQRPAAPARLVAGPFGVDDPAAGQHPVHVAWPDGLVRPEAVAVVHLAGEQVGHRRERDVRVRPDVDPLPGRHLARADVVEEDERTDHPASPRGERAAHAEPAQIARARLDDQGDGRDRIGGARRAHDLTSR